MDAEVIVALSALVGTIIGSGGGIVISAKLTNYRIAQLEKKVDKHNNFAERVPLLEAECKRQNKRLEKLEEKIEII